MTKKTTTKRKTRKRVARTITCDPQINTTALAQCVTKFMLASEKQIVRKFARLRDAQTIPCGRYGDAIYVPGTRQNSVLLVAHYDTVWGTERLGIAQQGFTLCSERKGVGIGADDRAGIAALWLLRSLGHSMLIVPAEEIGCQGSRIVAQTKADMLNLHQFAIQFDRRGGHDLVMYDCENDDFDAFMREAYPGYDIEGGSFSDISELCPAAGIAGVNVSIGFRNEHTSAETLDLLDFARTLALTRSLLRRRSLPRFEYVDGWGSDLDVWKDIDNATRTDTPFVSKPGRGKAKAARSTWRENSVSVPKPGDLFADNDHDTERWCHDCGTVSNCNTTDGECAICGGINTEAIA